jgi:hypothetical protein
MKMTGMATSVWPGYVAAIASLVLSLLLLLAILVISITQVGSIVGQYMQELLRSELLSKTVTARSTGEKSSFNKIISNVKSDQNIEQNVPLNQIKVELTRKLDEIPPFYIDQIRAEIKSINASPGAKWIIWSYVYDQDALIERAAYRFMLSIRRILMQEGIGESQIEMRLQKSKLPPKGYEQGEISIYMGPLHIVTSVKGKP